MAKNPFDLEVQVNKVNGTASFGLYTSDCYTSSCYTSSCYTSTCYTSDCYTGQNMCGYTHTSSC
ncbi:elgicin/penisin family lantibiotic [Vallitalea pronyensis]|uniref:Elgicin/penisin family lantibiotic n=1 Tax=Vallitalea pronyensis TaxID=1348613 RepID=A0A8J8MHD2_9FIRM|nr:elgicin/penisin family lantibiotic [Vallitalea pronyensis]QUI21680.1 elgicin/penisin family lantibiotic [Vallitalea pronyensis]